MKTILFDFDQTLTKRDTLRPFAHYLAWEFCKPMGLVLLYFVLFLARLRVLDDKRMKEFFLRIFIKAEDVSSVNSVVKKYFKIHLDSLLIDRMFEVLIRYRDNGDNVFIVSANFDFFLEPLIQLWGIDGVICTQTQKNKGVFTGKIIGNTCKGKTKVERIRNRFSSKEISHMIAFGNRDDKELLGLVGEGIFL